MTQPQLQNLWWTELNKLRLEISVDLEKHEKIQDGRHEENDLRFRSLEKEVAGLTGQLKVAIAVLIANGALTGAGVIIDLLIRKGK
jgi:hypothetical protein